MARAFFTAMSGDLTPAQQKSLSADFENALTAIGKPGLFGFGSVAPDPAKLKQASDAIMSILKGDGSS